MKSSSEDATAKAIVWTIAASDSGGGAGIQGDLKALQALGVHGCSILTAITAQSSLTVAETQPVHADRVAAQWDALISDMPPASIKIGMLGSAEGIDRLVERLAQTDAPTIFDPVMISSTGTQLVRSGVMDRARAKLLPQVSLLSPNRSEAEFFLGRTVTSHEEIESAAHDLLDLGVKAVLIKGGHFDGERSLDYFTNQRQRIWLGHSRLDHPHTHGTGCALSSAIAAGIAQGLDLLDAITVAKAYVHHGIRTGYRVGKGEGTLSHAGWPDQPRDLPWLAENAEMCRPHPPFPPLEDARMGLYPIVDRADCLETLLPMGIRTIQLRAKDLRGQARDDEVRRAIEVAKRFSARLLINDAWEAALRFGAYGVHLGQDDLPTADLDALRKAGIRLGISTHSYAEIARSLTVRPSYVALGTLFKTRSKVMDYAPLGLPAFRRIRRLVDVPVVAIGGIHLENAKSVIDAGADGLAVISEVRDAPDLEQRVASWYKLYYSIRG